MKAVAMPGPMPITDAMSLQDVTLPDPTPGPQDLLIHVQAVAVNPVDTKVRASAKVAAGDWRVLGWDAVGTVRAMGSEVKGFAVGDRVWWAGAINRPGCNAELQAVDARIVAHAPRSLDDAQAAAMPLTSITAWELLFDRLQVPRGGGQSDVLLIVGAAGGVGSMLLQLARQFTGLTVVATASRPESEQWVREMGAHHVIDHRQPLDSAWQATGLPAPRYIASLTNSQQHFAQLAALLAPQGKLGVIDDPEPASLDVNLLKGKSASLHWEFMFARSLHQTSDMQAQQALLTEVAQAVDAGQLRSTLTARFGKINAANLRRAHAAVETGHALGKLALEGFGD